MCLKCTVTLSMLPNKEQTMGAIPLLILPPGNKQAIIVL